MHNYDRALRNNDLGETCGSPSGNASMSATHCMIRDHSPLPEVNTAVGLPVDAHGTISVYARLRGQGRGREHGPWHSKLEQFMALHSRAGTGHVLSGKREHCLVPDPTLPGTR